MSEIKFSDGIPKRERHPSTSIYPEELLDKKCGGCLRCQSRERKGKTVYCCAAQPCIKVISPEDKACVIYWDKEEEKKVSSIKGTGRREPQKRTLEYLFKARTDQTSYRKSWLRNDSRMPCLRRNAV